MNNFNATVHLMSVQFEHAMTFEQCSHMRMHNAQDVRASTTDLYLSQHQTDLTKYRPA